MLTVQQQPLAIATKVLKSQTLAAVRRSPSFHLIGWKILDRWALNSPQRLRALEGQGELILLGRLLEQQEIEKVALASATSEVASGMTEHEILAMLEIQTEL